MDMAHLLIVLGFSLILNAWGKDSAFTEDEGGYISCKCGEPTKEWRKPLDLKMVADVFKYIVDTGVNETSLIYYPEIIRSYFKKCSSCELSHTICHGSPEIEEEYHCNKYIAGFTIPKNKSIELEYRDLVKYLLEKITEADVESIGNTLVRITKRETEKFPEHVHIPIGGLKNRRLKRHMEACHYPTSLQTAELDCTHYPSKVTCIQKCAFGFTLKGGTKMEYKCRRKENKWKPDNFQECQPFIDCTITLISGGSSKCKAPTLTKGPVCNIKCDRYEDKPSVSPKKYSCDIKGKWSPTLPFCAHAGSGLDLVEKPKEVFRIDGRDLYHSNEYDFS